MSNCVGLPQEYSPVADGKNQGDNNQSNDYVCMYEVSPLTRSKAQRKNSNLSLRKSGSKNKNSIAIFGSKINGRTKSKSNPTCANSMLRRLVDVGRFLHQWISGFPEQIVDRYYDVVW